MSPVSCKWRFPVSVALEDVQSVYFKTSATQSTYLGLHCSLRQQTLLPWKKKKSALNSWASSFQVYKWYTLSWVAGQKSLTPCFRGSAFFRGSTYKTFLRLKLKLSVKGWQLITMEQWVRCCWLFSQSRCSQYVYLHRKTHTHLVALKRRWKMTDLLSDTRQCLTIIVA